MYVMYKLPNTWHFYMTACCSRYYLCIMSGILYKQLASCITLQVVIFMGTLVCVSSKIMMFME